MAQAGRRWGDVVWQTVEISFEKVSTPLTTRARATVRDLRRVNRAAVLRRLFLEGRSTGWRWPS